MATYVIYADTSDGATRSYGSTYDAARSGTGTVEYPTTDTTSACGQQLASSVYYYRNNYYRFDTSSVTGAVESAKLGLSLSSYTADAAYTLEARAKDWTVSLSADDFVAGGDLSSYTLLASLASSSLGAAGYYYFASESAFASAIVVGGYTGLFVSSSRARLNQAPTGNEYAIWNMADASGTTNDPLLVINTVPSAPEYRRSIRGTQSSGSTSASVDLSSCSPGEYALVLISRATTGTPSSAPSGWTLLQSHSSTYAVFLYGKLLTESDLTTVTWSGYSTSAKTLCTAHIFGGCDQSSPVESAKGTFLTSSAQTMDYGSLTTNQKTIVILGSCYSTSAKTYTAPTNFTERYDYGHTDPDFWQTVCDTDGAWGGGTCAPSTTTNYISAAATYRGGFMVALAAAAELIAPNGVAASGVVGLPTVVQQGPVRPNGVAPAGAVGSPTVAKQSAKQVAADGVAGSGAVGTPSVSIEAVQKTIVCVQVYPTDSFGLPDVLTGVGQPSVRQDKYISAIGIAASGACGATTVAKQSAKQVVANGVAAYGDTGVPTVVKQSAKQITVSGWASGGTAGSPAVSKQSAKVIIPLGVGSVFSAGSAAVSKQSAKTIAPNGVAPSGALGAPSVTKSGKTVVGAAVHPTGSFGPPVVLTGVGSPTVYRRILPNAIAAAGGVGVPSVSKQGAAKTIAVSGVSDTSSIGSPNVFSGVGRPSVGAPVQTIVVGSINGASAFQVDAFQDDSFQTGRPLSIVGRPAVEIVTTIRVMGVAASGSISLPSVIHGYSLVSPIGIEPQTDAGQPSVAIVRRISVIGVAAASSRAFQLDAFQDDSFQVESENIGRPRVSLLVIGVLGISAAGGVGYPGVEEESLVIVVSVSSSPMFGYPMVLSDLGLTEITTATRLEIADNDNSIRVAKTKRIKDTTVEITPSGLGRIR